MRKFKQILFSCLLDLLRSAKHGTEACSMGQKLWCVHYILRNVLQTGQSADVRVLQRQFNLTPSMQPKESKMVKSPRWFVFSFEQLCNEICKVHRWRYALLSRPAFCAAGSRSGGPRRWRLPAHGRMRPARPCWNFDDFGDSDKPLMNTSEVSATVFLLEHWATGDLNLHSVANWY